MIFYINRDKRTCVAVLEFGHNPLTDTVGLLISKFKKDNIKYYETIRKIIISCCEKHIKRKYSGKAKCNPVDIWDEKIGMHLAAERARKKYWRDVSKATAEIFKLINSIAICAGEINRWAIDLYSEDR